MTKFIIDENGKKIGEVLMYDDAIGNVPNKPEGKRIGIVIGHDVISQGAYGNEGVSEWKFNDELISEMSFENMLPPQHKYFMFYRSADLLKYSLQMQDIHDRMDAENIDISIELHFNSYTDASVNGNEVLYCSEAGKEIAQKLDSCLDSLPNRDRGIKQVDLTVNGGGFCCRGRSIAIISEPFFAVNQSDFIRGGKDRSLLKKAYQEFFNLL